MSKETKDRKQVYAWLSQGKSVQVNIGGWTTCSEEGLLRHLISGSAHSYRVEELISINGFTAPKPVWMEVYSHTWDGHSGRIELRFLPYSHSDFYKIKDALKEFCDSLDKE